MAEEKKTPTSGQKPPADQAKRKAPVQKDAAKKEAAKQTPAAKKAAESKKPAAGKPSAGKESATKETAKKPAAKPAPKPKPKPKSQPKPEVADVPVLVRASARYVRVAPRKARLVADQVRGLHIDRARALLEFSPRGAAEDIRKLIDSAASNAENNHELVADEMRIAEITVDEGPTLRRYRPRALGRATKINKRTSHISVALTPED
jgi:large subunit ribosomal protein L22